MAKKGKSRRMRGGETPEELAKRFLGIQQRVAEEQRDAEEKERDAREKEMALQRTLEQGLTLGKERRLDPAPVTHKNINASNVTSSEPSIPLDWTPKSEMPRGENYVIPPLKSGDERRLVLTNEVTSAAAAPQPITGPFGPRVNSLASSATTGIRGAAGRVGNFFSGLFRGSSSPSTTRGGKRTHKKRKHHKKRHSKSVKRLHRRM